MSELTVAGAADQDLRLREAASHGAEGLERRLTIALAGGVLLAASWIASLADAHIQIAQIPAALGAVVLVIPLLLGAWKEIRRGRPSTDSLASLAVLAAIAVGSYLAAGFLALFLWTANLILSRTAWGAQRAIRELIDLTPDTARLMIEGEEGRVTAGTSDINQASLTGEAVPVEAQEGREVYAGTTNLTGQIDIEVTAVAGDTTIGKVEQLIREAESAKTQRQELGRSSSSSLRPTTYPSCSWWRASCGFSPPRTPTSRTRRRSGPSRCSS
jgi:cation transport ATPase